MLGSPEKYSDSNNGILLYLLELAFNKERLEKEIYKRQQELQRSELLRQQLIELRDHYYKLKDDATAFYQKYLEYKDTKTESPTLNIDQGVKHRREMRNLRLLVHYNEMSALAIASVFRAVESFEKGVSVEQVESARTNLQSYFKVTKETDGRNLKIELLDQQIFPEIVETIKNNPQLKLIIISGPPGSGKTRAIKSLATLIENEGIIAIEEEFDQIIASFFKLEEAPTAEWKAQTAREFDKRFNDVQLMIEAHFPRLYKDEEKRYVILIDTLGYQANDMMYGLFLINNLRSAINMGKGLVVSITSEEAVINKAIEVRQPGMVNYTDPKETAKNLKNGATAEAVKRHIANVRQRIKALRKEPAFKKLLSSITLENAQFSNYTPEEMTDLEERLAFTFLTQNELGITSNWYSTINLFKADLSN